MTIGNPITPIQDIFGPCLTQHLAASGEVPPAVKTLVNQAVVRLLDSEMLIEDTFAPMADIQASKVQQPLEQFEQTAFIDELTDDVINKGFGHYFHQIIGLFGSINLGLTATDAQRADVEKWVEQGLFGHFMMTDAGGPSLANWKTSLIPLADGPLAEDKNQFTLNIDKKWTIEGQDLGFAMVVCQQKGRPFPSTVLLSPEKCSELAQTASGASYLDGKLQLGDTKGQVQVSKQDFLSKGGLGGVNRFLTLVRPRFVKSLMHHLLWLNNQQRIVLDDNDKSVLDFIINMANWCNSQTTFSIHSVDRVLALKFTSNELLQNLVVKGAVKQVSDARDMLGFSKMEGSSYRCLFEVYSKFKRGRR